MLGDVGRDGSFYLSETRIEEIFAEPLVNGPHQLHLLARDARGYTTPTVSLPFTLDTGAPLLEMHSPVPGSVFADNVEVSGVVHDADSSVALLTAQHAGLAQYHKCRA